MSWLLLRGLMRDSRHWGDFPARLAAASGQAVYTADLPGNGSCHAERSPARVEALADAVAAGLRRRGIGQPLQVVAMSLGAMVAVAWAARAPQAVARLVLVNTSLRPFSPAWQRLRPGAWPTAARLLLGPATPLDWERAVLRLTSQRHVDDEALLGQWLAWREARPVTRANALRQLAAAARYRAPLRPPPVPGRLLVGAADMLVDPRCSQALSRAWGWPLDSCAGAGHDLPLDDPDWLLARLLEAPPPA